MDRESEIFKTINITVSRCYLRLAIRQFTQLNNSPLHIYINRNQACQTIDQQLRFSRYREILERFHFHYKT